MRCSTIAARYHPSMRTKDHSPLSIRLRFGEDARLGPGKIALLEALARTGSIEAAGQALGMSARRARLLITSLEGFFGEPLVQSVAGALPEQTGIEPITPDAEHALSAPVRVSELGLELVRAYRALEADAQDSLHRHFATLGSRIRQAAS